MVAPRQAGSTLKPFLYALAFDDAADRRLARRRQPARDRHRARRVRAAELRPRLPRQRERAHRARELAQRAGGAHARARRRATGFTRRCATWASTTLTEAPTTTARRSRWAAPTSRCSRSPTRTARSPTAAWRGRVRDTPGGERNRASAARVRRAASFIVTDILADRSARATTFGLENPLATRVWSAAKTGTSKDMRDNWCVGYTSRYTVGVWVGNFSGAPMHDVSGVTGAAPVWRDLVHFLHRARALATRRRPRRASRRSTCASTRRSKARAPRVVRARHRQPVVRAAPRASDDGDDALPTPRDPLSRAGHGHRARSGHSGRAPARRVHRRVRWRTDVRWQRRRRRARGPRRPGAVGTHAGPPCRDAGRRARARSCRA